MNIKQLIKYLGAYSLAGIFLVFAVLQIIEAAPHIGFHQIPIWGP